MDLGFLTTQRPVLSVPVPSVQGPLQLLRGFLTLSSVFSEYRPTAASPSLSGKRPLPGGQQGRGHWRRPKPTGHGLREAKLPPAQASGRAGELGKISFCW